MNKLVSKNPVLRFKLGKKIEKFLRGGSWAGYYTVGNWPVSGDYIGNWPRSGSTATRSKRTTTNNFKKRVSANIEYGPGYGKRSDGTIDESMEFLKWNEHPTTHKLISGLYVKNGNRYWLGSDGTTTLLGPAEQPALQLVLQLRRPVVRRIPTYYATRAYRGKIPVSGLNSRDTVKAYLQKIGLTGEDLDGIWGPKTLAAYEKYINNLLTTSNDFVNIPTAPAASVQGRLGKPYGSYWDNTMLLGDNDAKFLRNNLRIMPELRTPSIIYDRSGTRDWIRNNLGRGAYEYTGALRRALRYWLNGDKEGQNYDKNLLGVFGDLSRYAKQGAKLVLRNPIERFLQGRNLPIAPKAEDRYKNGRRTWNTPLYKEVSSASNIFGDPFASRIAMEVNDNNDTTFYETPGRWLPVNFRTRTATKKNMNFKPLNSYSGRVEDKHILISPEYEILKRRFNTAWNLAK